MFPTGSSFKAYRYRLEPTAAQRAALLRHAGARRWTYNWALAEWRAHFERTGRSIPRRALFSRLTALKRSPGYEWLREVDSQALQQAVRDVIRAYDNFFARRTGYPKFKSRKTDRPRFRIPQRVKLDEGRVFIPKVGWVRVRLSRQVDGKPQSATFKQDAYGHWFVSLVVRTQLPPKVPHPPSKAVGIDLGIRDFAVLTDGRRVRSPRFEKQAGRRLRRLHRALARTERGSRGRRAARRRLARRYQRVADQRKDFLHKFTTDLTRQYDVICIEDLGVHGMARTKLARAVGDSAFSEFRRQLEYKTAWQGKSVVAIDRFFPSSKRCGACGEINITLQCSDRSWTCVCGVLHDRDRNAANNILERGLQELAAAGHADASNDRGARVSLPMEATGAEAVIPCGNATMEVLCSGQTTAQS